MEERRIDLGEAHPAETLSLRRIVERYRDEIAPNLRQEENCVGILAVMLRQPWMGLLANRSNGSTNADC